MRIPLLVMACAMWCVYVSGQTMFQRSIGGVGDEHGHAIVVTQDGGYAIAGYTTSFGAGEQDILLVKLDSKGVIQWQKTYGGKHDDEGMSIMLMEVPGGDLVVAGATQSFGGRFRNLYVFKTDLSGNLVWSKVYDSGPSSAVVTSDFAMGILYTRDGHILISGNDDALTFGSNDGLAIKVDISGNLVWKKAYGVATGGNEHLQESIEFHGGNVLIAGSGQSHGPGSRAGALVKMNASGDVIWSKAYGGNGQEEIGGIDLIADSSIVVTGITSSFGAGGNDILLIGLDTAGVVKWSKTYGGSGHENGAAVKALADGSGYLICAETNSYGNADIDILLIRTNIEGDVIWSKVFDSGGEDAVDKWANRCLVLTEDGGFALTGWTTDSGGNGNLVVIKSDADGTNLCDEVDLTVTAPDITTVSTNTLTVEPGTYSSVVPTVGQSAMVAQDVCCDKVMACTQCETTVVHFDLNDCYSDMGNGSNLDYSEFTPVYPNPLSFADINGGILYRESDPMNKHSCTPGVAGSPAMCIGSLNSCTYSAGSIRSVVFELMIVPDPDSAVVVTGLMFYEKAPQVFEWIGGASGPNNYPTRFGVRVLKNGTEIFVAADLATSVDVWREEVFDFTGNEDFQITDSTTLRFELLGYCLVGNGAGVDAWDLDEVSVLMACEAFTGEDIQISGFVRNDLGHPVNGAVMSLSSTKDFTESTYALTDQTGKYVFDSPGNESQYYIKALKNTNVREGVSTLDIIKIQKHLLGLEDFHSPYQYVAADVNRTKSVSALDIVLIRQLLLGKITEFPESPSWRFGDGNQNLSLEEPWSFEEMVSVPHLGIDIGNAHMKAVKMGDVTGDAVKPLNQETVTTRGNAVLKFWVDDQHLIGGQAAKVDVYTESFNDIEGFQFALDVIGAEVLAVINGVLTIDESNYHTDVFGTLRLSWNATIDTDVQDGETLFTILLMPTQSVSLNKMMSLNRHLLTAQAYLQDENEVFTLEFNVAKPIVSKGQKQLLLEIVPNPFDLEATIKFFLEEHSYVTFTFYDPSGTRLKLYKDHFTSGIHEVKFAGEDITVGEGVVFCQIATNRFIETQKLIISR